MKILKWKIILKLKLREKKYQNSIMMKRKKLNLIYSEQVTKTVKNNGYKIKF